MKSRLPAIIVVAFIWMAFLLGLQKIEAQEAATAEPDSKAAKVAVLTIKDSINVGVAELLKKSVGKLNASDEYQALIIQLDTPGGFLEATRDIVQLLLASKAPVIVWVSPEGARAASAGSMITMAAHFAAMAPSTSIGAATPVTMGKEMAKEMKQKITNDTLSFVEGIAKKRGRNVEWAKKSVSDAASLESQEAAKRNVIDGVYANRETLWRAASAKLELADFENVTFEKWDYELKEKFLSFFSNPNVAYGLMALGALGIYVEMTNPGSIIPGAIGAVSLALGAISLKILPVRPGALVLFLIALILIAIEIFVPVPTFGVAGVMGGVGLMLSGIFLLDPEKSNLSISLEIWIPIFLVGGAFCVWLGLAAAKALRSKGVGQGVDALVGRKGTVVSVDEKGHAQGRFLGEIWNLKWARPEDAGREFKIGANLEVVAQEGFVALVKEV